MDTTHTEVKTPVSRQCGICRKNEVGQKYTTDPVKRHRRFYFVDGYEPLCGHCVKGLGFRCGK